MFPWEQNLPQLRKIGLNIYKMTKVLVFLLFSNLDIHIQLTSHKLRIWQIHCTKQTATVSIVLWLVFLGTRINFYHQSLIWQIRFIGITFRNRNDLKTYMSPKFAPAWVMAHEIWKWGTHCTTFRLTFSRYFSWSETLLGNLVGLRYLSIVLIDYIH